MTDVNAPSSDVVLSFFKLLSDINRLKMVGLLALEQRTVEQIAGALRLPRAQVIHHLGLLAAAGLASTEDGNSYRLEQQALLDITRVALARTPRVPAGSEGMEEMERKVIADFSTADGRLKSLPAQSKKQLVVLRYVNAIFTPGVRYAEKEVNRMLSSFHEDTASLRRALVDNHLMARAAGIYWRTDDIEQEQGDDGAPR